MAGSYGGSSFRRKVLRFKIWAEMRQKPLLSSTSLRPLVPLNGAPNPHGARACRSTSPFYGALGPCSPTKPICGPNQPTRLCGVRAAKGFYVENPTQTPWEMGPGSKEGDEDFPWAQINVASYDYRRMRQEHTPALSSRGGVFRG